MTTPHSPHCTEMMVWVPRTSGAEPALRLIDQTLLPLTLTEIVCCDVEMVWEAIKVLRVRGAPAIGIAAAYGVCLGMVPLFVYGTPTEAVFFTRLDEVTQYLASSRPTAVNLFWAIDRMKRCAESLRGSSPDVILTALEREAVAIHNEDRATCRAIGECGAALIKDGDSFLTHCNAGGLATSELGTALAAFFVAHEQGKRIHVYADETRPLLQGARLTAWELQQAGIDVTIICDSMAAMLMRQGKITGCIVGADRIAANGDTANKIGTYSVAVSAQYHKIPFYVAAPFSTFDLTLADGSGIPIEERDAAEIRCGFGKQTAPDNVAIYNPAFDVTPAELITGIVTERGLIRPVNAATISDAATP
ncbi:MAG: S-methyl-5-thioribose-1-phosphate isomerase [Thermoguttaceae bacterium]